ncbi:hypothetical protein M406DRAFT_350278 [Cryphonectria parasitica EP155]|uniref:Proteasome inhibitor PI31 subunit n=1 Tax=Cryphonectria parasitica (strain ATCC 38755 / EP155) TaxID=660469 RepID=A0A9P4Y5F2_CRYP1|nr:uncharacterized protein M406DRAFT_350278 [Cryphonectria parasitica EP155]KAF3766826.1 hypothetical protein M406DRAFT_350278 [Cryphonectria parasitica EP155]
MAGTPLSPQNILQGMADALPNHETGDTTSDMSSSAEALALFTHACMVNLGFRLLGFHEDHKIEQECASLAPRLPSRWNASVSSYSFLYAHTQSSMQFVLKIDRMGSKTEIRGLAVGADKITRLEISARDYISSSALPLRITLRPDGAEDRSDLTSKLQAVFISPERVADLASLLKINIFQRLIPGLQKEGYEETADALQDANTAARERSGRPQQHPRVPEPALPELARPYPFDDPLAAPRRPGVPAGDFAPPGFEDELEINRPPRGGLRMPGDGRSPFNIGHDDLHPPGLAPYDPLRGSFVPGGGLPRPGGMGGGMHPTFDDPLFQGGGGQGGGHDPQAPPGARWDPVGPGMGPPRFGGGRPGGSVYDYGA